MEMVKATVHCAGSKRYRKYLKCHDKMEKEKKN